MSAGFFKNVGGDVRQLVENSFFAAYKDKFIFFDETFKYTYTRSNGAKESQIYTYKSLIEELQKKNINITDINIAPDNTTPIMFGMLRLTCLFKNGEKPITIQIFPRNIESIIDKYCSDDIKV